MVAAAVVTDGVVTLGVVTVGVVTLGVVTANQKHTPQGLHNINACASNLAQHTCHAETQTQQGTVKTHARRFAGQA